MLKELELYWNRDHSKYAILVSSRGVGWSVMNVPELAYDKRVVEFVMRYIDTNEWEEMEKCSLRDFRNNPLVVAFDNFLRGIGYTDMYLPPMSHLSVVWVDAKRQWRITDGGEGQDFLEFADEIDWNCAEGQAKAETDGYADKDDKSVSISVEKCKLERRSCVRGKTSCEGCEFLMPGGICSGVIYPT